MPVLDNPPGSLVDGRKSVTTAGTRVQLTTTPTQASFVAITAQSDNSGTICVGGPTVVAAAGATRTGTPLLAGATASFEIADISRVWIDSTVSGESVSYTYAVS